MKNILDKNLGAALRAKLAIAVMIIGALTDVANALDGIPQGAPLASSAAAVAVALLMWLGRFTKIGNQEKAE